MGINSTGGVNMRRNFFLLLILALPALLLGQDTRSAPEQGTERIAREVRHQLVMLPYYNVFDDLAFSVTGYNVTLKGQVTDPTLKKDAERAVKSIEGVENIDNQIEVLPNSEMDDGLRRTLYRAIYGFPPLEKYAMPVVKPIHIIVKTGNVTLEGVVDNQADKDMAGVRANGVANVFSVTNNLAVGKP
jgi:hyperosmotically inducible periplasmic protein